MNRSSVCVFCLQPFSWRARPGRPATTCSKTCECNERSRRRKERKADLVAAGVPGPLASKLAHSPLKAAKLLAELRANKVKP